MGLHPLGFAALQTNTILIKSAQPSIALGRIPEVLRIANCGAHCGRKSTLVGMDEPHEYLGFQLAHDVAHPHAAFSKHLVT